MSDVLTKPEFDISEDTALNDGKNDDSDQFAHIIKKSDWEKAYILGQEVVAFCGKKWKPSKDPENLPVCGECQIRVAMR